MADLLPANLSDPFPNGDYLDDNDNQTGVTGGSSKCADPCSLPVEESTEQVQQTAVLSVQQADAQSSKWMDKWKSRRGILQQQPVTLVDAVIPQQYSSAEDAKSVPESQQDPSWISQLLDGAQLSKVTEETTPPRSRSPSESSNVSSGPSTVLTTVSEETLEEVGVRAATPPGGVTTPPMPIQKVTVTPVPAWMLKWMSSARKAELDVVFDSP